MTSWTPDLPPDHDPFTDPPTHERKLLHVLNKVQPGSTYVREDGKMWQVADCWPNFPGWTYTLELIRRKAE